MKISLIVPTRNRVDRFKRMYKSAIVNADDRYELEFCLYIDWDDEASIKQFSNSRVPLTKVMVGDRVKQSAMWNNAASLASGEILMQCADDAVFLSRGWDSIVRAAFESFDDRIALVWGNDDHHGGDLATLGFIHRNWYDTIGYFVPPFFDCWYSDTWLTNVALGIGRAHYIPDLLIGHEHPSFGKASWDETYTYRLSDVNIQRNSVVFNNLGFARRLDSLKLKQFIESKRS